MLITENYKNLNTELHKQRPDYGANGHKWGQIITEIATSVNTRDVLDYGAGKQTLRRSLPLLDIRSYDPAFPEISASPEPADIVFCGDVLEHVEPDCLDAVLDDIKRLAKKVAIFVVSTRPAGKNLPDGRNAHLIVQPYSFWLPKLWERFSMQAFNLTAADEFLTVMKHVNAN